MYEVITNKKEKMYITVISDESVSIKIYGGQIFEKSMGIPHFLMREYVG